MAEYIEREALLTDVCDDQCGEKYSGVCENCRIVALIADTPAVDVAPVVHARWEPCFDENCRCRWGFGKCSNCGQEYYAHAIDHYKYCPVCGAKMDGGDGNAPN